MKERPILFSGEMVRGIIDGRKTQTRRVAKLNASGRVARSGSNWHCGDPDAVLASPYGQPGDRLWVRETWFPLSTNGDKIYRAAAHGKYRNNPWADDSLKWRPSIHMPRSMSRIDLEIISVKVERLQEISAEDALAEGITGPHMVGYAAYKVPGDSKARFSHPVAAFEDLWNSINAERGYGWDVNPFVWVIEFKVIETGTRRKV